MASNFARGIEGEAAAFLAACSSESIEFAASQSGRLDFRVYIVFDQRRDG